MKDNELMSRIAPLDSMNNVGGHIYCNPQCDDTANILLPFSPDATGKVDDTLKLVIHTSSTPNVTMQQQVSHLNIPDMPPEGLSTDLERQSYPNDSNAASAVLAKSSSVPHYATLWQRGIHLLRRKSLSKTVTGNIRHSGSRPTSVTSYGEPFVPNVNNKSPPLANSAVVFLEAHENVGAGPVSSENECEESRCGKKPPLIQQNINRNNVVNDEAIPLATNPKMFSPRTDAMEEEPLLSYPSDEALESSKIMCRICHCEEGEDSISIRVQGVKQHSQIFQFPSNANPSSVSNNKCSVTSPASAPRKLIAPCLCSGSLKYVHQECLQQWIKCSDNRRCELCHFPYVMKITTKSLRQWETLQLSRVERRQIFCSVSFHLVALVCVVWSLFVLIDRTTEEIRQGELEWPFWTKLVVVTIGFSGGVIFMYVQCRMYINLCRKWRSYNRIFLVQSLPPDVTQRPPLPPSPLPPSSINHSPVNPDLPPSSLSNNVSPLIKTHNTCLPIMVNTNECVESQPNAESGCSSGPSVTIFKHLNDKPNE